MDSHSQCRKIPGCYHTATARIEPSLLGQAALLAPARKAPTIQADRARRCMGSSRGMVKAPRRWCMGYNRGGARRTARLQRRKRLENRLAQKLAAAETPKQESLAK